MGFADILSRTAGPRLDEASRRHLSVILDSVGRMSRLIDDLLEFSRMGRAEFTARDISLDDVVREALRDLDGEIQPRDIAWTIAPLGRIKGDHSLLRQVFVNLIGNAVKFTRTRSRAEIAIGTEEGRPGELVVYVRDNGVGFDMAYAEKTLRRLPASAPAGGL
ncbi:MAG: ATP-binding protein [Verrucomicrobiota bacterium]